MIRNYLTIVYRNLFRHKGFSFINIFGLALGMAACLVIVQYASYEFSYDTFHTDADRIYRVRLDVLVEGNPQVSIPKNFAAAGHALKKEFPEIKEFARIFPIDGTVAMKRDEVVFNEKGIYFADPSFLQLFSFPLLHGNKQTALTAPNSMVISQTAAKKYFGKENPIGKRLVLKESSLDVPLTITGVLADVPENSHLEFDFLVSHATLVTIWGAERADHTWAEAVFYTYILLHPQADIQSLESKFPAFIKKYVKLSSAAQVRFEAQPLQDIYLHSNLIQEAKVNGSSSQLYFLLVIALFIIVISWLNYINLSTAISIERAKEVGIRKVAGASRVQLLAQFVCESLLIHVLAIILSLTLVQLSLPYFISLTSKPLSLWNNSLLLFIIIAFFITGAIISPLYPGIVLSSFKPVSILKGKFRSSVSGILLRKAFTVVQFTLSIALIVGTLIVYQQLNYMRSKDLGMNIAQTLVLPIPDVVDSTFDTRMLYFKNELAKYKEISHVVSSSSIPGKTDDILKGGLMLAESTSETGFNHYGYQVDEHFLDAFELRLLAGRNFSKDFALDTESIIINKAALQGMGLRSPQEAIGKKVETSWTHPKTIIGVVDNFHQQSLKSAYDPIVFVLDESVIQGYYSIKLNVQAAGGKQLSQTMDDIKVVWDATFPGNPFDYFFLDEYFNKQYTSDQRFGNVFTLFACLAISVACLGLFGLVSFTTTQRTKEIGVRKVLGASVSGIVVLLSRDFIKLVITANLIAWPLSYWVMKQWLSGYAFQMEIQPWLFLVPSLLVLFVSLCTMSVQTIRAARANPVKSLRYE